jgi:hypothetical protein
MPARTAGKTSVPPAAGRPPRVLSRRAFFVRTRRLLGCSQAELGRILGASGKAVQSWEQGWRAVPTHVLLHLLVLLDDRRARSQTPRRPCWIINRCARETMAACPAARLGTGRRCWAQAGRRCRVLGCRQARFSFPFRRCPVIAELCAAL